MSSPHARLVREARGARGHLVAAVLMGVGTAVAVVVQALMIAELVAGAFLDGRGLGDMRGELIALVAASLARGLLGWGYEVAGHVGAARVMGDLRLRMVRHVLRARPGGLDGARSGDLAASAVQGVDALEAYFGRYVPQMALAALVPAGALVVVAGLDPVSAAILGVTLPLVVVFMILIGRAAERAARRRHRALQAFGGRFLDVVRGLPALRAANRAEVQADVLEEAGDRFRRDTMATLRIAFLSALVLELAAALGVAVVAVSIGVRLVDGSMELAAGLAVLVLAPELYLPLRQLGTQFHASADGLAAAERIHEVLDLPPAVVLPGEPVPAPDPADVPVVLEGVVLRHPTRPQPALDGLDLTLRPGEFVALTGPSGAGKSTAVALLLRLADPEAGRVRAGAVDLRDVDPAEWRRRVTWVPQRPSLLRGTIEDNVRMGDRGASPEAVRRALADAAVLGDVERLPDGLATVVGEGGRALSAGQAQRVALARAFLRPAPLVVLDEPTAALDPATAAVVGGAIGRLARGRTLLVVTHSGDLAARAGRVVRMEAGAVAAADPAGVA
ncbi:MAG: thiol reductant ABC exporter subunit CydD [Thermoleophilia bacterium]